MSSYFMPIPHARARSRPVALRDRVDIGPYRRERDYRPHPRPGWDLASRLADRDANDASVAQPLDRPALRQTLLWANRGGRDHDLSRRSGNRAAHHDAWLTNVLREAAEDANRARPRGGGDGDGERHDGRVGDADRVARLNKAAKQDTCFSDPF